jgi:hypothetical protein
VTARSHIEHGLRSGTAFVPRTTTAALLTSSLLLQARLDSLFVAPAHHSLQQHASRKIMIPHLSASYSTSTYSTHPFDRRMVPSLSLKLLWPARPSRLILVPFCTDSKRCFGSKNPAGCCPYCPMHSPSLLSQISYCFLLTYLISV